MAVASTVQFVTARHAFTWQVERVPCRTVPCQTASENVVLVALAREVTAIPGGAAILGAREVTGMG